MEKTIRILYVNGGLMNRGGIESYMMNYYRHLDRNKIQIDFIVHNAGGYGYYDEEIKALGGQIFVLPQKSKHPLSYTVRLKTILRRGNYKIIHTHMDAMGAWVLKTAKDCGIPVRIAHSHNTQHLTTNPLKLFFLEQARKNINLYATHRMACSHAAGKWLFGNADFIIINNAIEINQYLFNAEKRTKIRRELNIDKKIVIGHIGRFDIQKNHQFLISMFQELHQKVPNTKLLLIGDGHLKNKIEQEISKRKLNEDIIILGVQANVASYYSAFDLFVLPSHFEGLPVVGVEAQYNGLHCYFSDTITNEIKISPQAFFLPINSISIWVDTIISNMNNEIGRKTQAQVQINHYDIRKEVIKLQNFYIEKWNEN